ncbi:MAG: DNA repair protein RadA [Candidatus Falkowbacteria bacterium]
MADKNNTLFVCSKCDAQYSKWSGRCLECGSWGTIAQELVDVSDSRASFGSKDKNLLKAVKGANIIDLNSVVDANLARFVTGISEVDRVLGGGLVPGSLILLSGEPGVGKSTIVAQIADALAKKSDAPILYVSGEESASQVKSRLDRLGCELNNIKFISEINVEKIIAASVSVNPTLVIVDSIQTVYSSQVPSEAGNLNQIRACAVKFLELAKTYNIAVCLIGHITKDGQIAGPKSLEHIVDTVIYLETETLNNYYILRASKNRFGSVNELGILEMTGSGFREVANPTAVFIAENDRGLAGSVISCIIEGTRPFLVDIQALVTKTIFGYPQRKASGFDLNRLQVLTAVLSKRQKVNLSAQDVILNVVGGLKISDPAMDLAVCLAMVSSLLNLPLDRRMLVLGEVGLGGELRPVAKLEFRLKEAEKMGFTRVLIPEMKLDSLAKMKNMEIIKVKTLSDAVDVIAKK